MFWGLKFNRLILSLFENWKFFTRTKKVNDGYVYKMFELFICNAVVHVALVPSILVLNYLLIAWSQCFQSQVLPVGICRIYRWEPSEWICMSPSPGFRSNDTRGGVGGCISQITAWFGSPVEVAWLRRVILGYVGSSEYIWPVQLFSYGVNSMCVQYW